ncbi:MAG: NAD(P)/FAD-dependent oxidoreductase [Acidimicrobiales bacterium]
MTIDVGIIGAGPAGCAAAITLARRGLDVTVFDKATFPRDKFCGDGLTVGALRLLEDLGLDPVDVPSWHPVTDVWVRSPGGRDVRFPLPLGPGLFAVVARRRELDAALVALARQAGVTVCEGHRLVGAQQGPHSVSLELEPGGAADGGSAIGSAVGSAIAGLNTGRSSGDGAAVRGLHTGRSTVEARFVIGADGMWSPLRRLLGLDSPGYRGEWHAFRQYVRNVSPAAARDLWVLFERDLLPGYFWSFPVGDGDANIGFGIVRGGRITPHDMKARWPDLLARPHVRALLGPDAEPEAPHRAWPIPTRIDDVVLADGRVLFVGDAAAAADPMTGEGIGQALATGRWAAEAIVGSGVDDPLGVARRYESTVRREMVADHRFARLLGHALGSERGASAAIALGGLTPWTRRNFARWLFEDYPRATVLTPRRWSRHVLVGRGAYLDR